MLYLLSFQLILKSNSLIFLKKFLVGFKFIVALNK